MHRFHKPKVALLVAAVFGVFAMQSLHAQDSSNVAAISEHGGGSVRIEGDAGALRVDVHLTTIADALSALGSFNVRFHSSVGLDEVLDGTYTGSLGHVVGRLLDGYNYAAK